MDVFSSWLSSVLDEKGVDGTVFAKWIMSTFQTDDFDEKRVEDELTELVGEIMDVFKNEAEQREFALNVISEYVKAKSKDENESVELDEKLKNAMKYEAQQERKKDIFIVDEKIKKDQLDQFAYTVDETVEFDENGKVVAQENGNRIVNSQDSSNLPQNTNKARANATNQLLRQELAAAHQKEMLIKADQKKKEEDRKIKEAKRVSKNERRSGRG
eukprot:GHVL01041402.1.p2 GENE.GHVL01041402.1~~GHVL01041402.1.p2  ORF type:complete len:215 (-),score=64.47 GHVL01041402.1:170-814(-)